MLKVQNERISAIVTLIVQMFLVMNMILTAAGKNPIPLDEAVLTEVLTYILTIAWSVWTWWRNNNMTKAAVVGQMTTNQEKALEKEK